MTANSLSPASVVIDYTSAYGPHKMTIPTLAWISTNITGTLGSYAPWSGPNIDAEVMINAMVDLLKPFYLATTSFNLATIYTQASPTAPNVPQASAALTQVGTNTFSVQAKAVQNVLTIRTVGLGKFKVYTLDAPTIGGAFEKLAPSIWPSYAVNLFNELAVITNAWSGRDDTRPNTPVSITSTMNEKLRKEYRMT